MPSNESYPHIDPPAMRPAKVCTCGDVMRPAAYDPACPIDGEDDLGAVDVFTARDQQELVTAMEDEYWRAIDEWERSPDYMEVNPS